MLSFPAFSRLTQLSADADRLGLSPKARERLQWLLYYTQNGCSVVETCSHFGIQRSTFYRLLWRFNADRPDTLEDRPAPFRPGTEGSVTPELIALIRRYRQDFPREGQAKLHARLLADHRVDVPEWTIGSIIERECLYFADTPFHIRKRLLADEPIKDTAIPDAFVAVRRAAFWTGIIGSTLLGSALAVVTWLEYSWQPAVVIATSPLQTTVYRLDGPVGVVSSQ
jgi:hypothetical protein